MTINLNIDEKVMWKDGNFILRRYEPQDDNHCKDLERTGSMSGNRLFFAGNFIHKQSFVCKASQYGEYEVLVIEDQSDSTIAGAICVSFKSVYLNNKIVKLGYMFDLRITSKHQLKGFGTVLSTAAIKLSWEAHDADYLYLTVNTDNKRAINLYKKLQFNLISHRSPATSLLAFQLDITKADDFMVTDDPKEAHSWYREHWDPTSEDFALVDMETLFSSPHYIKTFMLADGLSSAGVSLWDGGGLTTFCVTRAVFPSWVWSNPLFQLFGFGLLAAAVFSTARCASTSSSYGCMFASGAGSLALAFCLLNLFRVFVFLRPRLDGPNTKLRGRVFAPFCKGPRGKEYLGRVYRFALSHAKKEGFITSICNLDVNSPNRDTYGSAKFRTDFYGKARNSEEFPMLNPLNFHDPRDL
eukprot:TRINITY_DN2925_c4_g1_i1.p1 TRINITY_DN2925_c4_g1~~TRINITY_DN2925_c4_g1_i1.p1  ORF type:complete len:432 (+),score=42.68 TRINITY_DN2925_c4_g1_i1:63-1298(+)